ncbi:TonB-dependent receptor [Porphyromonas macacae]|uniref:TonB-dependent receptor n=1 Tax=Porphyromonas macacae TaxID=28115 RepID=UPI00052BF7F8|nr:TonB-dependent receptor [Porphyromonas macacae]KGN99315.1 TonB-dependent receptor [Porphyromonas macacae]
MKKLFILLLILCTVASVTVYANNINREYPYKIHGVVLDKRNEPVPGASVWVVGSTIGVQTNSRGEYVLKLREKKNVKLRFSCLGYIPLEKEVLTGTEDVSVVSVSLAEAVNQLEEVVVTGNRVEKPLKDVPVLTRVISHKDIQMLNPVNLESLLQYELPGLQIGYNSMSQMPYITYQGVGGAYLLFLVDGERVSGEGSDHNVDFSRFNIDDIERVEVIKGSQSTSYGSNALGGVINIVTKKANRPVIASFNGRYAGENGQKYNLSGGIKRSIYSTLTSVTYRTRDTYKIGNPSPPQEGKPSTGTLIRGFKVWDAVQKLSCNITDNLSVELKGSYYHNKRAPQETKGFQDIFSDYTLNGRVNYLISPEQQLKISYLFDHYKKDKDFESGRVRTDYRNRTQTARADYVGTFGDHTVSAGLDFNYEYLKHYMLKDSADAKAGTYALYAQEDWKVGNKINFILGLRADYHSKYHWHLTPKLSAMYRPVSSLALRVGFSQGFRSPSLKELYQEYDMGGLGIMMLYGNPDLKPETSHQFALSAEYTEGAFNASVSAYYNRFRNKIVYALLGDNTKDRRYVNAEKAKTLGAEYIMRYRFSWGLTLTGAYAYVNDFQETKGKNTSFVRPHSITFSGMYSKRIGKVRSFVSLNGQWDSKLKTYDFSSDGTHTLAVYDARTLCSLNLGAQFPRGIMLMLGIDNLFNYKDKAADSSLQLPQKGLSLVGTLNLNFADMFNW